MDRPHLPRHDQRSARADRTKAVALVLAIASLGLLVGTPAAARPHPADGATAEVTSTSPPTTAPTGAIVETAGPGLRRAAHRLVVTTTSDWVRVDLTGITAGHLVVDNPGGRVVWPTARGVQVNGTAKVLSTVTVDLVTEVARDLTDAAVTVTQGGAGSTTVQVLNHTVAPYEVAVVKTSWSATQRSVGLTADALMGETQLPWTRAVEDPKVFAFTYPWFGEWAATDERLSVHPTQHWITSEADSALEMAQLARGHGIDGFVMSFSGASRHGLPLHHSLRAGEATGGTVSVLIETEAAGSAAVAEQWINEALDQADSPAFLRHNGVPVLFTFASGKVTPTEWAAITARLAAAGRPAVIVGDTWHGAMTGHYRYNALLETASDPMTAPELTAWNQAVSRNLRARATLGEGAPGLVVATAQPGWDDRLIRGMDRLTIPWDGTATYDATWEAALAGEPDWVVITSWNEWYEGTGIAPSLEHGTAGLEATARWAARLGG